MGNHLGIPEPCVQPCIDMLHQLPAMTQAGLSPHIQALVAGSFDSCFWHIAGSENYAKPTIGFSAGVGLADLAFTLVYRLYLCAVRAKLVAIGFVTHRRS